MTITETPTIVGHKVHICSIEHKYGVTTLVHATHDGLMDAFYEWIVENWTLSAGIPRDKSKAIEEYFDLFSGESYWVDEITIGN
jgi:hypothetical protein